MEFKGTKGALEPKYVSGICIGIGTVGDYSQITANSILPDTDEEYEKEKEEIEANMLLYSKSYEMLQMLEECKSYFLNNSNSMQSEENAEAIGQLIQSATELKEIRE